MRSTIRIMGCCVAAFAVSAFTANHDVYFAGRAGSYPVRVVVHTPGVIPGLAEIIVTPGDSGAVTRVLVQPIFWNVPPEHAPRPDEARKENDGAFHANLWLMVSGSYGVRVTVTGPLGEGTAVVPVTAVPYELLDMPRGLGVILLGLTAFLAVGLVTIVRAAARQSTLPPGETVDVQGRRRGWIGLAAATAIAMFVVTGGRAWWNQVDATHRARLYQPAPMRASVNGATPPVLRLQVRDTAWRQLRRRRPIVSDEGKLAHIFLVGDGGFAHVHPFDTAGGMFRAVLPPLPSGPYQIFVEMTDSSGFTEMLKTTAELPQERRTPGPRRGAPVIDGTWAMRNGQNACDDSSIRCVSSTDGIRIVWNPGLGLSFTVRDKGNTILAPDTTQTEWAEAVLLGPSGDLRHLHPYGTMSTAALEHYAQSQSGVPAADEQVTFPYELRPADSGEVWVQFKLKGKTATGVFRLPASP